MVVTRIEHSCGLHREGTRLGTAGKFAGGKVGVVLFLMTDRQRAYLATKAGSGVAER